MATPDFISEHDLSRLAIWFSWEGGDKPRPKPTTRECCPFSVNQGTRVGSSAGQGPRAETPGRGQLHPRNLPNFIKEIYLVTLGRKWGFLLATRYSHVPTYT